MNLLTIKDNARKLATAINSSNEIEEKTPPFLTHRISEIYGNNLRGIGDFFKPTKTITFSQQVACAIKQSWQLPYEKVPKITQILRQELFRVTTEEEEAVTCLLRTIFLRSHGNPFDITARLLTVAPVTEAEIFLINDKRFDFEVRLKIVKRLFSARNEMTSIYASEFVNFIGSLNDSYRKDERDEVLELARKAHLLPYNRMLSLILTKLSNYIDIHPQGAGALKLAMLSFDETVIEKILTEKLWESNLPFCRYIIDSPWPYKRDTIQKLIELYEQDISSDLKIVILEKLKFLYKIPSRESADDVIQEFVITQKESETDLKCQNYLSTFDEDVNPNELIAKFLQDPDNYSRLKQLRNNSFYVVSPLLEIVKDKERSQRDKNATLYALSKINNRYFDQKITSEILVLLKEEKREFSSTHYKMFDCLKTDFPGLKEYLEELTSSNTSDAMMKKKVISVWDRIYPDSPRPKKLN
ncbi:hypothetical protein QUF58_12960 [Anaerolineales bacterium HSG24]|nr:hypothetical protein [Anaerolineales bacterium HSG24]